MHNMTHVTHMTLTTEEVWEAFSTRLHGYIRRQVHDDDAAEDLLQEVFLRIHTHGATVRAEEKLAGWLYQVTRNAIMDYHRRRLSDRSVPLPPNAAERFAIPKADAMDEAAQGLQALLPCVRSMVEALPTPYREALLLTEYDGLSQKALAERLGLSFSGAKSRVQRAREKLRSLLLACCHLEFDHAGRVIDYQPECACCATECQAGEITISDSGCGTADCSNEQRAGTMVCLNGGASGEEVR